ncbi:MAG: hypothetical protein ACRD1E_02435 [Terriglobales bacterium]
MKLGTEKKGEVTALAALLVVGGVLLWRSLAPAPATPGQAPVAAASAVPMALGARASSLDPTLHLELLRALRAREYTGAGRDLFHFGSAPALAPRTAPALSPSEIARQAQPPRPAVPAGPPPPPPIPLKFYGYAQANGMAEKIFLQMGEDNFVVSQGDVIAHRYQIENIGKVSVRVRDLMTQSEQELPLQQG